MNKEETDSVEVSHPPHRIRLPGFVSDEEIGLLPVMMEFVNGAQVGLASHQRGDEQVRQSASTSLAGIASIAFLPPHVVSTSGTEKSAKRTNIQG